VFRLVKGAIPKLFNTIGKQNETLVSTSEVINKHKIKIQIVIFVFIFNSNEH